MRPPKCRASVPPPASRHRSSVATVARAMVSRDLFCKKRLLEKNAEEAGEYDSWFAVLEKKNIEEAAAAAAGD